MIPATTSIIIRCKLCKDRLDKALVLRKTIKQSAERLDQSEEVGSTLYKLVQLLGELFRRFYLEYWFLCFIPPIWSFLERVKAHVGLFTKFHHCLFELWQEYINQEIVQERSKRADCDVRIKGNDVLESL